MPNDARVTQHTAGPWKVKQGVDDDPTRWVVVADGGPAYIIATVENGRPGDFLDTETATARLIAAAPDLLAALKDTRDACAALMRVVASREDATAICAAWANEMLRAGVEKGFGARADAAVAKAEGRDA